MSQRTKVLIQTDHVSIAVIDDQGGGNQPLIAAIRIPRRDWQRIAAQTVTLQPGQTAVIYGDGGDAPGELPLPPETPTPTNS